VNVSAAGSLALSPLLILAAYLVGSIPFAYLVAYWVKGIDIRSVGSGNPGATNVGRELGFRYFLLVLALDLLKGFLPTIAFPWIFTRFTGASNVDLPVLVALAAILGHTFPVYLKFRGGKGVATSLGCVLGLDAVSCGIAVVVFGGLLLLTRYVSLSSLGAGVAFVVAHFLREPNPFNREHIAMSLFSIAVLALLLFRHRGNLARIWAGTERRVNFRRLRGNSQAPASASGKIAVFALAGVLVLGACLFGGVRMYQHANQSIELAAGPWYLRETSRVGTGQQRVDRVAFAAAGTRLAATCPRYDRLNVYRVESDGALSLSREIELEGRPVAVANINDRFIVLERPSGDERHVEPGWWETFDTDGNRAGGRNIAGYYPDDLAVTPDGAHLVLLSSGQAEGDPKKPLPALEIIVPDLRTGTGRKVGSIAFNAADDPARLTLSASGKAAAVLLAKTNHVVSIDLSAMESPREIGRARPSGADVPYLSRSPDSDWILMPVASQSEAIVIETPDDQKQAPVRDLSARPPGADYLVCARHHDSVLELFQITPLFSLGRLPLTGPLNLGRTRPTGLAYSRDRGLLAVATRSGSIHMVAIDWRLKSQEPLSNGAAANPADFTRR
jgi:glycerol-3-phosphate acyltransferase PlsY